LALIQKFAGSNLAKSNGFLRVIKICSMMGSKAVGLILLSFYGTLKIPSGITDIDKQNSVAISCPVPPCFNTRCLCCNQSKELWWMNWERLELGREAQ
jgi:predicted transporter